LIAVVAGTVLEQLEREILAIVDRDTTIAIHEREAAACPRSSVAPRVEQRI
jgi:hypothetical protein